MKTHQATKLHPLHDVVMGAFEKTEMHDALSLSCALAGATFVRGAGTAYKTVARDVLGYMESQGHLVKNELGLYVRKS